MDGGLKMPKIKMKNPLAGKIKNPLAGVGAKLKGKAQSAMLKSMMPKMPAMPSMSSLGSMFGSKSSLMPSVPGAPGAEQKGPIPVIVLKIVVLLIVTGLLGTFAVFTMKTQKNIETDSLIKWFTIITLFMAALGISAFFKLPILDFIISSQINIMCFYLLLFYLAASGLISDGPFSGIKKSFELIGSIRSDPTNVFKNVTGLLMPLICFIIPLIVLLYNGTKSLIGTILIAVLTFGSGAILLSPKWF